MAQTSTVQVKLRFDADTSSAKSKLQDLQHSLNALANAKQTDLIDTKSLTDARLEALNLQKVLNNVVNTNTGKFDISQFNTNLKKSGQTLGDLQSKLVGLGPAGTQAFNSLANSILAAEIPARRTSKLLEDMGKSLTNTIRWKISSTIIDGFTKSLSQALTYSEDLNKSMNDIRIVMGYNIDQMSKFAVSANKASKALSTTTNEYAKATLIYYQQGLNEKAVEARTATTIKLANVTGRSAEEVSSYMTGIWNNFDNGSKSLASYADTITALGAATASSSEEIAQGLQKFSAVANTVGLSYEYATSALATVVSQTRESADVVGTAFKTIFARLESLSLGETLEDETTLTKYSQALAAVGVSIKDSQGELRSMDAILDDLGAKWTQISRDQQVALAQTVAGMRQYNNFIALLDNYDTFQVNLEIAQTSEGSLEEQAQIYAEGWEAARDRVQASLEKIYETLLDDEFFVKLLNNISKVTDGIGSAVQGLGGLQGTLSTVGGIILRVFGPQLAQGINNAVYSIRTFFGFTQKELNKTKQETLELYEMSKSSMVTGGTGSEERKVTEDLFDKKLALQKQLLEQDGKLSEKQRRALTEELEHLETITDYWVAAAQEIDAANAEVAELQLQADQTAKERAEAQVKAAEAQKEAASNKVTNAKDKLLNIRDLASINEISALTNDKITDIAINTAKRQQAMEGTTHKAMELLRSYGSGDVTLDTIDSWSQEFADLIKESKQFGKDSELTKKLESIYNELALLKDSSGTRERRDLEAIRNQLQDKSFSETLQESLEQDLGKFFEKKVINESNIGKVSINEQTKQDFIKYAQEYAAALQEQKKIQAEADAAIAQGTEKTAEQVAIEEKLVASKQRVAEAQKNLTKVQDAANRKTKESQISWDDFGKTVVSTGQVISSITGIIGAVQGAFNVINNPDTTGIEKFIAVLTSLSGVLFNVVNGFKSMKEIHSVLSAALDKDTIMTGINTLAKVLNTKARKDNAKAADTEEKEVKEAGNAQANDAVKTTANTFTKSVDKRGRTVYRKNGKFVSKEAYEAGIAAQSAGGATSGVAASGTSAAVTSGTGAGATAASGAIGTVAMAAGVIAAVIAVIAALTTWQVKVYKQAETQAEKAEAMAKQASKYAQEQQEAYNTSKQLVQNYETASKELEGITHGTAEWKEKVADVNTEALKLLDTYENLKYTVQDGAIVIDETSLKEAQANSFNKMMNARSNATAANIAATEARDEANLLEFQRKTLRGTAGDAGDAAINIGIATGTGAALGAIVGSVIPVIGTLIGALAGAATGLTAGIITHSVAGGANEAERKAIEALQERYKTDPAIFTSDEALRKALYELDITDQALIDSLVENRAATKELVSALNQNTLANQAQREDMILAANADNEAFADNIYKDIITALHAQETVVGGDAYAQTEKDLGDLSNRDIEEQYIKMLYGDDAHNYRARHRGGDNFTVQHYENGKWVSVSGQKDDVNYDKAREAIITAQAANLTEEQLDNYQQKITGWTTDLAKILPEFANSTAQLAEFARGNAIDLTTESIKEIRNLDLSKVEDEELRKALATAQEQAEKIWGDSINKMSGTAALAVNSLANSATKEVSKIAQSTMIEYGAVIDTLFTSGGKAAASGFASGLEDLLETNADKAEDILAVVNSLDWTNQEQALRDLEASLCDMNIYIEDGVEGWNRMKNAIEAAAKSVLNFNFEKLRTELADLSDIANSVAIGEVISDENFKTLIKYRGDLADLFQMAADGYAYVGPEEGLKEIAQAATLATLESAKSTNERARAAAAEFKNIEASSLSRGAFENAELIEQARKLSGADATDLEAAGISQEALNNWIKVAESTDPDRAQAGAEELKKIFGNIAELQARERAGEFEDTKAIDVYASTIETLAELETSWRAGNLTEEAYRKRKLVLEYQLEQYRKEIDALEDLNTLFEIQTKEVERLGRVKSRASGAAYVAMAEAEANAIKAQAEALKDIIALQEVQNYNRLQTLQNQAGIDFDLGPNGEIKNLEVVREAAAKNLGTDSPAFEQFKKDLETYEKGIEETFDNIAESLELKYQALETQLDAIDVSVNLKVETRELKNAFADALYSWYEDVPFAIAESLDSITRKHDNTIQTMLDNEDAIGQGVYEVLNEMSPGLLDGASKEDFMSNWAGLDEQAQATWIAQAKGFNGDKINELEDAWKNSIVDSYNSYVETSKSMSKEITGFFEDISVEYDKVATQIENLNSTTDHYLNIIDLAGKKTLGVSNDLLRSLQRAQTEGAQGIYANAKNEYDTLIEARNKLMEQMTLNPESPDYVVWQQSLEDVEKQINDVSQNVQATFENALSAVVEEYKYNIGLAIEELDSAMAGTAGSLDALAQAFEQQSTLNNQYVADYKKLYELSKLRRQVEQSISDSNSIKSQRALRDLTAEITELERNGAKMSEYELEFLQKKYELKLAEQSLEEGSGTSRQMILRRDASGGWSYEYTAAEQETDSLQNYEDALYNLTELNQTHIDKLQSDLIGVQQQLVSDLSTIANDMTLSVEDKQKKMDELMAYYNERLGYYEEQLGVTFEDANWLYNYDLAGYESNIIGKSTLTTEWAKTVMNSLTGKENSISAYFNTMRNAIAGTISGSDGIQSIMEDCFGTKGTISTLVGEGSSLATWVDKVTEHATNAGSEIANALENTITNDTKDAWEEKLEMLTEVVNTWVRDLKTEITSLQTAFEDLFKFSLLYEDFNATKTAHSTDLMDIYDYKAPEPFENYYSALTDDVGATETAYLAAIAAEESAKVNYGADSDEYKAAQEATIAAKGAYEGAIKTAVNAKSNLQGYETYLESNEYTKVQSNIQAVDGLADAAGSEAATAYEVAFANYQKAIKSGSAEEIQTAKGQMTAASDRLQSLANIQASGIETAGTSNIGKYTIYGNNQIGEITDIMYDTNDNTYRYKLSTGDTLAISNFQDGKNKAYKSTQDIATEFWSGKKDMYIIPGQTYTDFEGNKQTITEDIQLGDPYIWEQNGTIYLSSLSGGLSGMSLAEWNKIKLSAAPSRATQQKQWGMGSKQPILINGKEYTRQGLSGDANSDIFSLETEYVVLPDSKSPFEPFVTTLISVPGVNGNLGDIFAYGAQTEWNDEEQKPTSSQLQYLGRIGSDTLLTTDQAYPNSIYMYRLREQQYFNNQSFGFDTGGYTGTWGPEGRLAMLHQKEIVLNASDTKNLLSAVDIIRQIAQVIDLQAAAAKNGLDNLSFMMPRESASTLQQEVTIHAEFPNATDHNEIEEAFNQLINHTSQFIHRH